MVSWTETSMSAMQKTDAHPGSYREHVQRILLLPHSRLEPSLTLFAHAGTCKAECSSSESRTELQLTKGFLPVPRAPSPTMPKEHGTQREFEHAWVENEIEEVGEDCVEAALQRRITSTSVRAQLSSVTAPFREDDSSDSNSDDESEADISGWGLEDVAESSWRPDFMSDTDRMDSTEDFGEVMYGMHNRDEYPLQYPGLD